MLVSLPTIVLVLPETASAQTADAYLNGAEFWTESDCTGDVPIVVGSDAKAQSDIYSAVTLAGVVGTDCVVLAGARDGHMPADQRARLDDAAAGGYVVGGTAAVPAEKLAGRTMTRLTGATRWETAHQVGGRARILGGGLPVEIPVVDAAQSAKFTAVSSGGAGTCGLHEDGRVFCHYGEYIPWGRFAAVSVGADHVCGVRSDGSATCSGPNRSGQADAPPDPFTVVSAGGFHSCGLRTDDSVVCWGLNSGGQASAPSDSFTAVSAGYRHSCGLRTDGEIVCWGHNPLGQTDAPQGTFTAVSAGNRHSCGLRPDGSISCWGFNEHGRATPPAVEPVEAPSFVRMPGVYLDGAEPWFASDCAGDVPIVVASDAAAQSDIYSAVTLAGVVDTDCVILAGARDEPMPPSQRERLDAAGEGGYVLGGVAAVPTTKLAARELTRLGGASRWETAQLVGRRASGDTTAGTSTNDERSWSDEFLRDTPDDFAAVSAGHSHTCGLGTDGSVVCWGNGLYRRTTAPSGSFTAISAGGLHSCGLRTDGSIACWGNPGYGETLVPSGSFTAVSAGGNTSCGVRTDASIVCWGRDRYGQADVPSGSFTTVSTGGGHVCGLRSDGNVACWGHHQYGQASSPTSPFTAISQTCGLRADGTVNCWRIERTGQSSVPSGPFTAFSARSSSACGVRTDGTVDCWGRTLVGQADPLLGSFKAVSAGWRHKCGLRANGTIACWGSNFHGQADAPPGLFTAMWAGGHSSCGLRPSSSIICWGRFGDPWVGAPPGSFTAVSGGCGLHSDGSVTCMGEPNQGYRVR